MIVKLIKTRAVKPELIRCTVEVHGNPSDDDQVTSDYELIVNTADFCQMRVDQGVTEMMINLPVLQELLSLQISELTLTGGVAAALNANPLKWIITEAPQDDDTVLSSG